MESKDGSSRTNLRDTLNRQRLLITQQIPSITPQLNHIDELFEWLSRTFVQQLDIQVVQFWALQSVGLTQSTLELRTMICQHSSLPASMLVNPQIVQAIESVLRERRGVMPQPVEGILSPPQADSFYHFHLNYWASYFLSNVASLPSARTTSPQPGSTPPPLRMVVSFFFHSPPHPRLIPTLSYILEQAISTAKQQGLLFT